MTLDLKKCDQLVRHCLKEFPRTRGSDRELIKQVWEQQGYKLPKKTLQLYYMIHQPKSIVRSRRKVQATGLFRADAKTRQKRLDYEKAHKEHYKKKKGYYKDNKWIAEE